MNVMSAWRVLTGWQILLGALQMDHEREASLRTSP
jgi:hypothetical protein